MDIKVTGVTRDEYYHEVWPFATLVAIFLFFSSYHYFSIKHLNFTQIQKSSKNQQKLIMFKSISIRLCEFIQNIHLYDPYSFVWAINNGKIVYNIWLKNDVTQAGGRRGLPKGDIG